MAELNIDYEKENRYLPSNLRAFIGQTDRVLVQTFDAYFTLFDESNRRILYNNWQSAKFASGFTRLNYATIRSGVAPRLLKIKVEKTIGKVYYQAPKESEKEVNKVLPKAYLSKKLYEADTKAEKTGRCLMALYKSAKSESKPYIETFDAFRHEIIYDNEKNITYAKMYLVSIDDSVNVFAKYFIVEKRYFKDDKPYQKLTVRYQAYARENSKDIKADIEEMETKDIPEWLKEKFKGVVFNREQELEGYTDLGVYHIDCTAVNSKFPDSDIPEAMFVDALDTIVMAEQGLTDKEVEKEIGRGQVLIPEFGKEFAKPVAGAVALNQSAIATPVLFGGTQAKDPIIKKYPTHSMEDSKPQNVQFDIRADAWAYSVNDDIARLCALVGISIMDYDPRLLQTGQRTDDEINAMTDITRQTIETSRMLNEFEINKMLACLCALYGLAEPVTIRWSMASILNPTKNTNMVQQQLAAGLISRKEAIKRLNPDLSDTEIEDLYQEILNDLGQENDKTIAEAYNNF